MRKIAIFLITIFGVALMSSCKKDEVKTTLGTNFTAPVITAGLTNASTVVLAKANKDVAFDIIWTGAYYGFRGSVTYTLQMDKKGNNFASALSLGSNTKTALASSYSISMITNDLNNKLLGMQADPEAPLATNVEFRVKAFISDSVPALYSPVISATYTPYFIPIVYPRVYAAGNYEVASGYGTSDWSQPLAPTLASLKSDGNYEGFIYFANNNSEFKLCTSPTDWSGTNYGDGGVSKLSTDGGAGNVKIATAGYYRIKANTNDLSYSVLNTSWSMIGSVIDPNWSIDKDLTYNPTTKVWTVTLNLVAGVFKFRSNHDWALNYGSKTAPGKLDQENGNDIPLAAAGNYTITLDLSTPPIYKYKVVKN